MKNKKRIAETLRFIFKTFAMSAGNEFLWEKINFLIFLMRIFFQMDIWQHFLLEDLKVEIAWI